MLEGVKRERCVCVCVGGEGEGEGGKRECVCVFTSSAVLVFSGSHLLRPRED